MFFLKQLMWSWNFSCASTSQDQPSLISHSKFNKAIIFMLPERKNNWNVTTDIHIRREWEVTLKLCLSLVESTRIHSRTWSLRSSDSRLFLWLCVVSNALNKDVRSVLTNRAVPLDLDGLHSVEGVQSLKSCDQSRWGCICSFHSTHSVSRTLEYGRCGPATSVTCNRKTKTRLSQLQRSLGIRWWIKGEC